VEAALEERLVGEDGERGGSGVGQASGQRYGVEIGADEAFRGRSFFELGDDGGSGCGGATERGGETTGDVRAGPALEIGQRRENTAKGEIGAGLGEDAIEVRQGGLLTSV
jgi:hypothetical protein